MRDSGLRRGGRGRGRALAGAVLLALAVLGVAGSPVAVERRTWPRHNPRPAHIAKRAAANIPKNGPDMVTLCTEVGAYFGFMPSNISWNDYTWGKNRDNSIKAWWIVQGCDYIAFSCNALRKSFNATSLAQPGSMPAKLIKWWASMDCDNNNGTDAVLPTAMIGNVLFNKTNPIPTYADPKLINLLTPQLPWGGAPDDPPASWIKENEVFLIAGGLGLLYIGGMSLWGRQLKNKKGGGESGGAKKGAGDKKPGGGGGGDKGGEKKAGGEGKPDGPPRGDRPPRDSDRGGDLDRRDSTRSNNGNLRRQDTLSSDPRMGSSRRGAPGGFMSPSMENFPRSPFSRGGGGLRSAADRPGPSRLRDRDEEFIPDDYDVRDPDDDMTPMVSVRGPGGSRERSRSRDRDPRDRDYGNSRRLYDRRVEDEQDADYSIGGRGAGGGRVGGGGGGSRRY
ncbi:hypothetical protein M427DRAFT_74824 [Gonapodya prolifera JEL478]|uniref:Uncharacterized protein n=1 Tax=Gonapodya prolifera (strain JEL478) TaxID=1344416 RepID=A0A139A0P0_GONPJ|nr:hypothetical protein M427DRAFT_74824 [Gonapodya prolifera JEL478]|eukprot:KXS09923.1 hypothetical protein M427DRAFT_74824 [Gonapodya prolifera JEL478]